MTNTQVLKCLKELKLKPNGFHVVAYAGNIGPGLRDPLEIPKAMKIFKSRGIRMECHIFGLGQKHMQIMKKVVTDAQVEDIVNLYGRLSHDFVLALLSISSVAINPMKLSNPYEGVFSLEALSFGLPLIVFGPQDCFVEMKGAYLVPKESTAIASLLHDLDENTKLLFKKSNEARDISRNFSIERAGQKLSEIIHLLIKEEKT